MTPCGAAAGTKTKRNGDAAILPGVASGRKVSLSGAACTAALFTGGAKTSRSGLAWIADDTLGAGGTNTSRNAGAEIVPAAADAAVSAKPSAAAAAARRRGLRSASVFLMAAPIPRRIQWRLIPAPPTGGNLTRAGALSLGSHFTSNGQISAWFTGLISTFAQSRYLPRKR